MQTISSTLLKEGYIVLPKALLKLQMNKQERTQGELEAWLQVLVHANYSETKGTIAGVAVTCGRGEAVYSYRKWMRILGWGNTRTMNFFHRLQRQGIIEILPCDGGVTHIRILNYDLWTGKSATASDAAKQRREEAFRQFWVAYHETVGKPKINIAYARREWTKLTENERRLAIERLEDFYYNQTDVRFIPQAGRYLANKAFLNEY